MIKYVQFRDPVNVGGTFSDLRSWDRSKHADKVPLLERGPMLILELQGGDDVEVPMGNVVSIRRDREDRNRHGKGNAAAPATDASKPGKERG